MEKKVFSSFRSFDDVGKNPKFCVSCGNTATKEALFNVDGAVLVEKYCDICAEREVCNRLVQHNSIP
jgi:hypothetical protein